MKSHPRGVIRGVISGPAHFWIPHKNLTVQLKKITPQNHPPPPFHLNTKNATLNKIVMANDDGGTPSSTSFSPSRVLDYGAAASPSQEIHPEAM